MAGLFDLLQSASNSVAGNVSAPVDGLAWLLRKAGVPIGEPVGGSDWMNRQGLTKPVDQSGMSLAGETLGLLSPMAAAKAPQIAGGLLKMGENAAAPRMLNPQTGAIVWHGSPHKFDAFDSSRIGTGEGAQAYGHGLYLADESSVARNYMPKPIVVYNSPMHEGKSIVMIGNDVVSTHDTAEAARKALGKVQAGNLYKVDLPDEQIAKMLDWDKLLSQQAPGVREAIKTYKGAGWWVVNKDRVTGEKLTRELHGGNPSEFSSALADMSVPGIRYLDGGSRGAGQGTSNYVVFPGNEGLLSILERNGQKLK